MTNNTCVLYSYKRKNECYAINGKAFTKMKEEQKCGTRECPFYKTESEQAQQEETCRKRLKDIEYSGTYYNGKYHGLVTGKR